MKKLFYLSAVAALSLVTSACSFVGTVDLTPSWHETRALRESYMVVNPNASGVACQHQVSLVIVPLFKWGDSFEGARNDDLKKSPGSDDIINVRSSTTGLNFLVYQITFLNIYGTTIKYTSGGKSVDSRNNISLEK